MAFNLGEIFSRTDAKARVFIIVATVVVFSALIYFGSRYFGATTAGVAKVANAPSGLQSVPGGKLSAEYSRALQQANTQNAKQAQMTGGSAVATLVNLPDQGSACTSMCPGGENADVTNDINDLVKQGKLSQEEGDKLLALAKDNVSPDAYAAALNDLVKQGKLTPEQARKLLAEYTAQHNNANVAAGAKLMDDLIKSGKLPLETANALLALQKQHASVADYAAALNEAVREGKISPEVAAQLLAQYTQQQADEATKEGAAQLADMVKSGAITQEVADDLTKLQKNNVPVSEYEAELNRLVAAGKLTPAAAAKLLEQYKKQHTSIGPASELQGMVAAAAANAAAGVNNLKIPQADKDKLLALQNKDVPPEEYARQLKEAVKAGILTPAQAATLMREYQAAQVQAQVASSKLNPNAPGARDFEKLQQQLQQGAATTINPDTEFETTESKPVGPSGPSGPPGAVAEKQAADAADKARAEADAEALAERRAEQEAAAKAKAEAEAAAAAAAKARADALAEAERARQKRILAMTAAMSSQSVQLIAAWQSPIMQHKGGAEEKKKDELSSLASGLQKPKQGGLLEGGSAGSTSQAPPLVKAGTIVFAVLDTAADSDYPDTPIMATIVEGKFKGAKVLGKMALVQGKDKLSLTFTSMDRNDWDQTKHITAFAVDPDTARTVLASNVNYHYMVRYGAMMATSFLTGYSSAITNAGTSTTGIFGTSATHAALSPSQEIAVGLGQVGTTMGAAMQNYINTPPTVKVNAGVALGILFMADVTDEAASSAGKSSEVVAAPATTTTTTTTAAPVVATAAGAAAAPTVTVTGTALPAAPAVPVAPIALKPVA